MVYSAAVSKWAIGAGAVALCAGLAILGPPSVEDRAASGDPEAQDNLGRMYAYGRDVPQDDAEAVKWFRRAADQGHVSAQFNLGVMYADGRGVPQDDAEAVRWFRLAADEGYAAAQARLGLFYVAGTGGVKRDLVTAHMWLNLAAARLADDRRDAAVKARDMVTALMTGVQITEAQLRAREWQHAQDGSQPNGADHNNAEQRSIEELLRTPTSKILQDIIDAPIARDPAQPAQDDGAQALSRADATR